LNPNLLEDRETGKKSEGCLAFKKNKIMDQTDIIELYGIVKDGFDNSDWNTIEQALEFVLEFIDDDSIE
jgi:hypothetical protein